MTLEAVLSIIQLNLQLLVAATEKMTPEQFQALWARHEARLDFWEGLAQKLTTPAIDAPNAG